MLSASGITAGYDPRRPVISNVSFQVEPGRTVGLAGLSGSGKSTLARVLSLLLKPFAGSVSIDGLAVDGYRHRAPRELRTRIGVLSSNPGSRSTPGSACVRLSPNRYAPTGGRIRWGS